MLYSVADVGISSYCNLSFKEICKINVYPLLMIESPYQQIQFDFEFTLFENDCRAWKQSQKFEVRSDHSRPRAIRSDRIYKTSWPRLEYNSGYLSEATEVSKCFSLLTGVFLLLLTSHLPHFLFLVVHLLFLLFARIRLCVLFSMCTKYLPPFICFTVFHRFQQLYTYWFRLFLILIRTGLHSQNESVV